MLESLISVVAEGLVSVLGNYLRVIEFLLRPILKDFGIEIPIAKLFERPTASVDERIAKIDEARANLVEGLKAIDQLRQEATENKAELAKATVRLVAIQKEHAVARRQLAQIRNVARADASALQNLLSIPTPKDIMRNRIIGFFGGVGASVLATAIWWAGVKIVSTFYSGS